MLATRLLLPGPIKIQSRIPKTSLSVCYKNSSKRPSTVKFQPKIQSRIPKTSLSVCYKNSSKSPSTVKFQPKEPILIRLSNEQAGLASAEDLGFSLENQIKEFKSDLSDIKPQLKRICVPVIRSLVLWTIWPSIFEWCIGFGSLKTAEEDRKFATWPGNIRELLRTFEFSIRVLVSAMDILQCIAIIAPSSIKIADLPIARSAFRGFALIVFLHQLFNSSIFGVFGNSVHSFFLKFEKLLSVSLLVLGSLAVAERKGYFTEHMFPFGWMTGLFGVLENKEVLSKLLAWIYSRFTQSYAKGDLIKIGTTEGTVIEKKLNSVIVVTKDGNVLSIPHGQVTTKGIIEIAQGGKTSTK